MQRIFSGIQPTGNLHLGNYLGAIKNWLNMQENSLFCIVDLHALTVHQNADDLKKSIIETAAWYLACGINHNVSKIFIQSNVPAHSELSWILGCNTPMGWLNRMTQFKEKSGKHKDKACLGLYSYPTLMAADILLYDTTHVPVGHDQKQHIELARDIAIAFNHKYETDVFVVPEPLIIGESARVMSLRDGSKKMSKSEPSDASRIHLSDDADEIASKIKKAKTDPHPIGENIEALEQRPEAKNLLCMYASFAKLTLQQSCAKFAGQNFSVLKNELSEIIISELKPIQDQFKRFINDKAELVNILEAGTKHAIDISSKKMRDINDVIGVGIVSGNY